MRARASPTSRHRCVATATRTSGSTSVGYADQRFQLASKVAVDPAYEVAAVLAAVEAALRDAFAFEARDLAQPCIGPASSPSRIPCRASSRSTSTCSHPGGVAPALAGADRSRSCRPSTRAVTPVPAGLLVLDPGPLDRSEGSAMTRVRPVHGRRDLPAAAGRAPHPRRRAAAAPLRELRRGHHRAGQRARREPRAALRRPVHRDVRGLGRAVHRRPDRLPHAARRRAAGRLAARRGREHDPLPPPQGHRVDARAARPRRHRLAGARGRVLRAARDDAVHEPRPPARGRDGRAAPTPSGSSSAGAPRTARSTISRTRPRCGGSLRACGPLQHPQRRHLPVACAGAARRALADRRRRTSRSGAGASIRSASTASSSRRRAPRRRSRTSPSRSTCRCRSTDAPARRAPAPSSTATAGRCCSRCGPPPGRPRARPQTSDVCISPTIPRTRGRGTTSRRPARRSPSSIRCSAAWPSAIRRRPARRRIATFHYGAALLTGGGGYDRRASLRSMTKVVSVEDGGDLGAPLGAVASGGAVQIDDCDRYGAPATITVTEPPDGAADTVTALRSANRSQAAPVARRPARSSRSAPNTTLVARRAAARRARRS